MLPPNFLWHSSLSWRVVVVDQYAVCVCLTPCTACLDHSIDSCEDGPHVVRYYPQISHDIFFNRAPGTFGFPVASIPPQVIALPLPAATFEPELYPERTEVSLTQPVEVSRASLFML